MSSQVPERLLPGDLVFSFLPGSSSPPTTKILHLALAVSERPSVALCLATRADLEHFMYDPLTKGDFRQLTWISTDLRAAASPWRFVVFRSDRGCDAP